MRKVVEEILSSARTFEKDFKAWTFSQNILWSHGFE